MELEKSLFGLRPGFELDSDLSLIEHQKPPHHLIDRHLDLVVVSNPTRSAQTSKIIILVA